LESKESCHYKVISKYIINNKKRSLALVVFVIIGLVWGLVSQWPDGKLHFIQCDVGQGDAIVITQGFSQLLVDGGPNSQVMECLSGHMPFWDRSLELVVATHPDKDHITGLVDVIERYNVNLFVSDNVANDTTVFRNLQAAVWEQGVPVHVAQSGEEILAGNISLKVLSPEKNVQKSLVWQQDSVSKNREQVLGDSANSSDESTNDESVVLLASFGEFDVLLTGDIGSGVERRLTSEADLSGIEVLKVAHHGSKHSTSEELLQAVRPKVATIGVGKNQWGHPTTEVLERLRQFQIPALRTDLDGEIEIVSDGKGWYIRE
jgi:competence protein ComEC